MRRTKERSDTVKMAGNGFNTRPDKKDVATKNIEFLHDLSNTFGVAMAGLGVLFVGVFALFLNETTVVFSTQIIADKLNGISDIQSVTKISQENNNRLVHITGQLKTSQPLTDGQFSIQAHAVKLRREVQMFQWVEHSKSTMASSNQANEVSTVYTKEWRSELIKSDSFIKPERHQNKEDFPIKSITYVATHVFIGSYYIKENLKERMEEFQPVPLIQPEEGSGIEFKDGWYYQKGIASHPDIGDIRARFFYCGASGDEDNILGPAQEVSIFAKQVNGQLTRYKKGSERLDSVHFGKKTAREMVMEELNIRTSAGWSVRLGGFLMILLGLNLANSLVYQAASFIPEVQDFFISSPVRFHLVTSVILVTLITALCWISIKAVFLLFMSVCVIIPFAIVVKVGSKSGKKASSKV